MSPSPPPPRVKIIINTAAHTIMELPSRATIRRVAFAVDLAASRAICFYFATVAMRLVEQLI